MTNLEIWLIALSLAMDCFAVSITSGVILKRIKWKPILTMAFFFGLFQGLMPLLGWVGINSFSHLLRTVDHWIAFFILLFIGIEMIIESFKKEDKRKRINPCSFKIVFFMAIATSIDALAIGISLACMGYQHFSTILYPISVIAFVSFAVSIIGLLGGIYFGEKISKKIRPEFWGGIILVLIGTKILIEHLFFN
ncbi:MAG: manganese efflux pump MntP family protein [Bacteroidaceae bacterium]|nr:manganese efflux pump MntP family protein [Bacteroidaceae bacterium]